jgi:hypothetical protein
MENREKTKNEENILEFIPCDVHPGLQAIKFNVKDNGNIVFKCEICYNENIKYLRKPLLYSIPLV